MKKTFRLIPFIFDALAFSGGLALTLLPTPIHASVPSPTTYLQTVVTTLPQTIPVTFVFSRPPTCSCWTARRVPRLLWGKTATTR